MQARRNLNKIQFLISNSFKKLETNKFMILKCKFSTTLKPFANDGEYLKKIDIAKDLDKLSTAEQFFIRKSNAINEKRYQRLKKRKKLARIAGLALTTIVLSIYFYTMYAISQEKFLDDFIVPEPPNPPEKSTRPAH